MSNQKTKYLEGNYYHVHNRGHNKSRIFFEAKNYEFFLQRIKEKLIAKNTDIISYCLMTNHFHLLIYIGSNANLSRQMQSFSTSYTKAINSAYNKTGSLFQGTYKGQLVDTNEYLIYLTKYIHLNPVRAGLVKRPEEYLHSSYNDFTGERNGGFVKTDVILSHFRNMDDYKNYINDHDDEYFDKLKKAGLID